MESDTVVMESAGVATDRVLRAMDGMESAWSQKNLSALFLHYWQDDGFVLFTSRGAYYGWPAARKMLGEDFANLEEIKLEFGARKVKVFGGVATVVYEWTTVGRSKLDGTLLLREGYGTDVFLLQKGEWKLYHNHVSLSRSGNKTVQEHPW